MYSSIVLCICMFVNRSPELFHLAKQKLYTHDTLILPPSLPPSLQPHPPFCFYDLDYFRYFTLSGIIRHVSFCHWLISLSVMSPGLLHVACCRNFLPFKGGIIFRCTHTVFAISIHLCVHLGCSPLLAVMSNAAVNMVHTSLRDPAWNS